MSRPPNPIRTEFSQRTRAYNLARLRAELFDLLIIGGGIAGAGIAREAALRGYKVALVERDDFASGSSSQSTKLIRGGFRRLEKLQLEQVLRASRERVRLLRLAPHLVWPLPFLYPIQRGSRYSPERVHQGLWLYDTLTGLPRAGRHRMLSAEETTAAVPGMDLREIVGGVSYYEAGTDDARLVLETIRSAHRHGAVIVNHFQVQELNASTGKELDGVSGSDLFGGEFISAKARVVVNATGPWADSILALDAPDHPSLLHLTRGIHLLVPYERFPVQEGIALDLGAEGRTGFIVPYNHSTLIGAWETEFAGSLDDVHAEPEEVNAILRLLAAAFPRIRLSAQDVTSTYAGIWPRLAPAAGGGTGPLAREHLVWTTPSGLVSIAGGSLTTHRALAEELVTRVGRILRRDHGVRAAHPSRSARLPLVEASDKGEPLNRGQAEVLSSLPSDTREYLSRSYGLRLGRLLEYVRSDVKLRAPIVDGLPYIWAEVPHAVEQEMALSVSDLMMRRLDLFHMVPDGAIEAAQEVARYMARLVDWLDPDVDRQLQSYADAIELNRRGLRSGRS